MLRRTFASLYVGVASAFAFVFSGGNAIVTHVPQDGTVELRSPLSLSGRELDDATRFEAHRSTYDLQFEGIEPGSPEAAPLPPGLTQVSQPIFEEWSPAYQGWICAPPLT